MPGTAFFFGASWMDLADDWAPIHQHGIAATTTTTRRRLLSLHESRYPLLYVEQDQKQQDADARRLIHCALATGIRALLFDAANHTLSGVASRLLLGADVVPVFGRGHEEAEEEGEEPGARLMMMVTPLGEVLARSRDDNNNKEEEEESQAIALELAEALRGFQLWLTATHEDEQQEHWFVVSTLFRGRLVKERGGRGGGGGNVILVEWFTLVPEPAPATTDEDSLEEANLCAFFVWVLQTLQMQLETLSATPGGGARLLVSNDSNIYGRLSDAQERLLIECNHERDRERFTTEEEALLPLYRLPLPPSPSTQEGGGDIVGTTTTPSSSSSSLHLVLSRLVRDGDAPLSMNPSSPQEAWAMRPAALARRFPMHPLWRAFLPATDDALLSVYGKLWDALVMHRPLSSSTSSVSSTVALEVRTDPRLDASVWIVSNHPLAPDTLGLLSAWSNAASARAQACTLLSGYFLGKGAAAVVSRESRDRDLHILLNVCAVASRFLGGWLILLSPDVGAAAQAAGEGDRLSPLTRARRPGEEGMVSPYLYWALRPM